MKNQYPNVFRRVEIKGVSIPGIIKNGSYFFTDLDIYENGRVACWNFKDFDHFKADVNREWVSVSIPNGKSISIHSLGSWQIKMGKWDFTKDNFIDHVFSIIETLNPKLENLYKYSEKKINGIRVGESGTGKVYKEKKRYENDIFPEKVSGKRMNLFYQSDDAIYHLIRLDIYSEASIVISRYTEEMELTLLDLENMINDRTIISDPP